MDSKEKSENEKLYYKVQNVIKYAKIDKFISDKNQIIEEGLDLKGFFTGRNTLQIEKLRNCKLKIELLESRKIKPQKEYKYVDMLADLYACAISELGGKFTDDMKKEYDKIKEKCTDEKVSDEDVYCLALEKIVGEKSCLPAVYKIPYKGVFCEIKNQIDFYRLENVKLENDIILERGKSQFQTFNYVDLKENIIIPVNVKNAKKSLTNA